MTSAEDSRPEGRLVAGNYRLEAKIGGGGMGSVYRARQLSLGRAVALKLLRSDVISKTGRDRFAREAKLLTRLSHPNLVPVYDVDLEGEEPYIAMELVEGSSLMDLLESPSDFPRPNPTALARGLASGLAYIHEQGILHRDIKPANILLKDGRHPMLADFGLSRAETSSALTTDGFVVGTPAYLAPEQLMAAVYSAQTDLYQLGLVLYEVIVGKLFIVGPGAGLQQVITARLEGRIPDLVKAAPGCPVPLARAVMRCLARDPKLRFVTAHELEQALTELPSESSEAVPLEALAPQAARARRVSATQSIARTQVRRPSAVLSSAQKSAGPAGSGRRRWIATAATGVAVGCLAIALMLRPAGRAGQPVAPAATPGLPVVAPAEVKLQDVDWSYDQSTGKLKMQCRVSEPVVTGYSLDGKATRFADPKGRSQVEVEFAYEAGQKFGLVLLRGDGGAELRVGDEVLSRYLREAGERVTKTLRDFWARTGLSDQSLVDRLREVTGTRAILPEKRGVALVKLQHVLDTELRILSPVRQFLRFSSIYFDDPGVPLVERLALYKQMAPLQVVDSLSTSYGLGMPFSVEVASALGKAFAKVPTPEPTLFDNYAIFPGAGEYLLGSSRSIRIKSRVSLLPPVITIAYHFRTSGVAKVMINDTPMYFSRIPDRFFVSGYKLKTVTSFLGNVEVASYVAETGNADTALISQCVAPTLLTKDVLSVTVSAIWLQRPLAFDHNVAWCVWLTIR